jgi:Tfp pilus assembly protein PilV
MDALRTTSARQAPPRPASAGVSIVELMVVLVLVAVGILALSGIQTHSTTDVYATGRRSSALAVGQTQMESKRALGFTQAVSDTGTSGIYNWTSVVDSVGPGLSRITVTVKWTANNVPDSLQLFNLVSAR